MEDKRYAVLIDSDNISSKYISDILDEMTKYGVITYMETGQVRRLTNGRRN